MNLYKHMILPRTLAALCLCITLGLNSFSAGFETTPALIHVNKQQQNDTVGFDLVTEVYTLLYKNIIDGSITLYGSPAKKVTIKPNALQALENEHGVRFKECDDLFIYEFWKLYKKDFEFQIFGLSFFTRNDQKERVNFGYIDIVEVRGLFNRVVIPSNINGCSNLTYWQALMSKQYHFNIAKFGNSDFQKDPTKAFDLKEELFFGKKIKSNKHIITPTKDIEYYVYPGIDTLSANYVLCRSVENFFNANRHVYYNLTQTPAVSYLDINTPLRITRIEVSETWTRNPNLQITYTPQQIKMYVNDVAMPNMAMPQLEELGILIQFKPMSEYLREKEFKYTIKRVNNEPIYAFEADEIKTSLYSKDWNKLHYTQPNTIKN